MVMFHSNVYPGLASQTLKDHQSYDEKGTWPHLELASGHHIATGFLRLAPRFKKIAETNVQQSLISYVELLSRLCMKL